MARFHALEVESIRRETDDCVSVSFRVPEELRARFAYLPGQHLGIRKCLHGEELRRTYSLCSDPASGEWRVAVKRVPGGRFSTFVHEHLRAGDSLEVMPPKGRFGIEPDPTRARHFIAFAAGSGITPIMSIMRALLRAEPRSRFTLVYANRRVDSIIFREAIEALKNQYLDRLSVFHVLSRQERPSALLSGRIDRARAGAIIDRLLDPGSADGVFLCGPFSMMEAVREALLERQVPGSRIHQELFAPAGEQAARPRPPAGESFTGGSIRIVLDGHGYEVPFEEGGLTILDLAQRAGVDVPFACKGGVCSTCRARLEAGEVDMPVNYALEEDERAAGYILTCQSFPRSDKLSVNFDG